MRGCRVRGIVQRPHVKARPLKIFTKRHNSIPAHGSEWGLRGRSPTGGEGGVSAHVNVCECDTRLGREGQPGTGGRMEAVSWRGTRQEGALKPKCRGPLGQGPGDRYPGGRRKPSNQGHGSHRKMRPKTPVEPETGWEAPAEQLRCGRDGEGATAAS